MLINPDAPLSQFYCNNAHKIAYLQLLKCGCSSFAYLVASLKTQYIVQPLWREENFRHHFDQVTPDEGELAEYFTFTFVRHPLTRFCSFYLNWVVDPPHDGILGHYKKFGLYENMPFADCVKSFVAIEDLSLLEAHTMPMYRTVFRQSSSRVKFIGKLENVEIDFDFVRQACGINRNIPHRNRTGVSGSEKKTLGIESAEVEALLYQYYRRDYELFGYPPGGAEKSGKKMADGGGSLAGRRPIAADPREFFCIGEMVFIPLSGFWREGEHDWLWLAREAEFEIIAYRPGQLSFEIFLPEDGWHQRILPLRLFVYLNDHLVGEEVMRELGTRTVRFPLVQGKQRLRIIADRSIIPHDLSGNGDQRELSVVVLGFRLDEELPGGSDFLGQYR